MDKWTQYQNPEKTEKVDKVQKLTCFHQRTRIVWICQGPCHFGTPWPSNLGHELGDIVEELKTSESPSNISSHLRRICNTSTTGNVQYYSVPAQIRNYSFTLEMMFGNADCHITLERFWRKITSYGGLAQCVNNPHCCKPHQKSMPSPSSLDPTRRHLWHLRSFCLANPVQVTHESVDCWNLWPNWRHTSATLTHDAIIKSTTWTFLLRDLTSVNLLKNATNSYSCIVRLSH